LHLPVNIGAHGVDVFFVISGFIIAYIGARAPDRFLLRRLIRIVPFYWAATVAVFALALLFPHLMRTTQADFTQLVYSLLFIPYETPDGGMVPTLILGWSLNYEMYFYALFAVSLLVARRAAPLVCAALIAVVAFSIDASGTSSPSLRFYGRPLVFEFCYGIACFYLLELAERHSESLRGLHRAGRGSLLAGGVLAAVAIGIEEHYAGLGWPRFLVAGLPAMILVLCAVLLERIYGLSSKSRVMFALGESSYILYLIHPYIIYTILRLVVPHARAFQPLVIAALIAALLAISAAVAVAIHYGFERPVMQLLRARLLPGRIQAAVSGQIPRVS